MNKANQRVFINSHNTGLDDARRGVNPDVLKDIGYGLEVPSSVDSPVDFTLVRFYRMSVLHAEAHAINDRFDKNRIAQLGDTAIAYTSEWPNTK